MGFLLPFYRITFVVQVWPPWPPTCLDLPSPELAPSNVYAILLGVHAQLSCLILFRFQINLQVRNVMMSKTEFQEARLWTPKSNIYSERSTRNSNVRPESKQTFQIFWENMTFLASSKSKKPCEK